MVEQTGDIWEGWLDGGVAAAAAERARRRTFDLSSRAGFLEGLAVHRRALRRLLRLDDPPVATQQPPLVRSLPPWRGASVTEVRWQPWAGLTCAAVRLVPSTVPDTGVLLCGGLDDTPESCLAGEGGRLVEGCLASGRQVVLPRLVVGWRARLRVARKARLLGYEALGLEVLALQRLLTRGPALGLSRWAVGGCGRGGQTALWLAALEPRVAALVVASWYTERVPRLLDSGDPRLRAYVDAPEEEQFLSGLLAEFTDLETAALVAPRPLLLTSGLDDPLVPWEHVESAAAPLRTLYRRLGASSAHACVLRPGGPGWLVEPTLAFLRRALGPSQGARGALPPWLKRRRLSRARPALRVGRCRRRSR